ncbi:MAG: hypothetical protein HXX13_03220 [Bacteroidetes bacterium]|nr:hypothetical protein [Bacteroidota bacterium]
MDERIIINSDGVSLEIEPKEDPITDIRKKSIAATIHLLDIENIDQIIYIDDKFDIESQKEEYKARLIKLKNDQNYITSGRFNSLDWTGPGPRFDRLISNLWEATENKSELLYEICNHFRDIDIANVIPALEIKNSYGNRVKLMTPDEWVTAKYQPIKDLQEGKKALCLFDFEFQNGNRLIEGRNGAHLAKMLIDIKEYSNRILCGIFSHKFTEEEEDEVRTKYSNDYNIEISKFYTLSKFRYAFDPQITGFAEGIKNLLLLPYVEQLKLESLNVVEDSNKKAGKRIIDLTPKTFNQIIQKSSFKEGVWEINTLFRLYEILSKEENFKIIADPAKRQSFNDAINKIREIDKTQTGYNSKVPNKQLMDLRNSELYIPGEIINKLHLPLRNGDVFKIKEKEYILLVQPCNLALRAQNEDCGKRDYQYDIGMLIPLKYINKDKLSITSEVVKVAEASDQFYVAYFPGFQIISLNILDLSVFNTDGKASIDFNIPKFVSSVIHSPWLKRYEYIYKTLLNYEIKILEFKTIKESINKSINQKKVALKTAIDGEKAMLKEEIKILQDHLSNTEKNVVEINDLIKFKINCAQIYNEKARILDMNIQRIKHYKSPYSDDLLQKLMLYMSRNAFEHDFTNS